VYFEAPTGKLGQVSQYLLANAIAPEHQLPPATPDYTVQVKAFQCADIFVDVKLGQQLR
jgi:hypothetical protein